MVSLGLLVILTLFDTYFAQGLYDNARYIAMRNGGMCSRIGPVQVLGLVLPWAFLALGTVATAQLLFWGRFRFSVMLLNLYMANMALVLCLMVLGNSYCAGAPVLSVILSLSEPILLVLLFAAVPLPVLVLQRRAMRIGRTESFDRL
jgi:hypothetical protein